MFNKIFLIILFYLYCIEIPIEKLNKIADIFPDHRWEDGCFIEDIKGDYCQVIDYKYKVVGITNILYRSICYIKKEYEDDYFKV